MPARHSIGILLIPAIFLLFLQPSFADVSEEAQKLNEEGKRLIESGDFENAINTFQKAIRLKPDYADAYNNIGVVFDRQDNYEKALEFYKEAIRIDMNHFKAHFNSGIVYFNLKQYGKAVEAFKEAIKIRPDYADAYFGLGVIYSILGDDKKKIEAFKKVVDLFNKSIKSGLSSSESLRWDFLGGSYSELGQYDKAIEALKEAIKIKPDNTDIYKLLGSAYGNLKQYEKSLESYKDALKLKPDDAGIYMNLGFAYRDLKQYDKAVEAFKEALKLKPDDANIYGSLGLAYKKLTLYQEAIEAFKSAIRIKPEYTNAYKDLWSVYHKLDHDDKAIEYLNETIMQHPDIAEPRYWLGVSSYINGKLEDAINHLEIALNLYRKSLNKQGEANTISALGEIYMKLGKDIYAINNFQKALTLYEELKDLKGLAGVFYDMALVYYSQLSDYDTALQYFQKALKIYEQLEDNTSILSIHGGITLTKFSMDKLMSKNYDETIKYGKQAIEFAEKNGLETNFNALLPYMAFGLAYAKSEDYATAIDYGKKALSISQKSNYKPAIAVSSGFTGMAYEKLGNYEEASDYLQKAASLSSELEHPSLKWLTSWGLGRLAEKTGNFTKAKNHYLQAINILETTRETAQSLASKMSLGIQSNEVYNDTILFLIKIRNEEEAFNYMERAKARVFLDLIGGKFKLQSINTDTKEIIEKERQMQFKINYLSEKIREIDKDEEKNTLQKKLLEKELTETITKHTELLEKIKKDYPEISSLLRVDTLNLKEVQELLNPDITLLEYYVTPEKTLLWVVNKQNAKVLIIDIKSKELASKVEAYRENISKLQPDYKKDAEDLYTLLIKPAKPYIKTKRIGIVPHSVLHYLPFQALLNKDKFLIEEYEMFYTPSASVLKFVYEKRKEIKGKVLAFGNPKLDDEKLNLPYAEDEVKKIKTAYPETSLYLREKATEDKAKKLSRDYNIIHFASHGELNTTNPMSSSIRLAKDKNEDGRLDINEIFNLDLKNTSLVTLSACETGLGKLTEGDELVGLTRGFIYAGTPSIVASLWRVNDQSTSELMNLFYKNLKNHPKSEALRMAQLEMIKGKTGKGIVRGVGGITATKKSKPRPQESETVDGSHPYFWAPFILLGDWK